MEHFYENIEGWFDWQDLYTEMVQKAISPAHFVEVGCYKGRSAAFMAVTLINTNKQIQFDCVDIWDLSDQFPNAKLGEFHANLLPANGWYNAIQGNSVDVAATYPDRSLDFVYIDADHLYLSIYADIQAWLPKVKTGGYIGGHDFRDGGMNVDRAVKELLPGYVVYPDNGQAPSWLYHKI
jgi:cephalosporin hydroxylase